MKFFLPARSLCIVFYLAVFTSAASAQTFENAAKDNQEAPYVQSMTATTTGTDLVLRFEPNPDLGRKGGFVQKSTGRTFHHADTQLIVTLNNEAMEEVNISVGLDGEGKLKVFSDSAKATADAKGVTLSIPLTKIQFTPVFVTAQTLSLFFSADNMMVAGEGRNLFSTKKGSARIEIPSLPVKPEKPSIKEIKVTETTSASATIEWTTNHRTDAKLALMAGGQPAQNLNQDFRTTRHKITFTDLEPSMEYSGTVSGTDFAGQTIEPVIFAFKTTKTSMLKGKSDAWLRVKGKYIVDSAGKPYPLGAYSHFVGEFWYNEFPRYGTLALTARHFRNMGLNACRLGLCNYMPTHWAAGISRDEDLFKKWGGAEGYVKHFLRPMADQIMDEGVYLIIDWHWTYGMTPEYIEQVAQFWEACAKEFKDEPRVAMYQLLNEPSFNDGQNRPDLAPRIRKITKDIIQRIRKHDKRHILLVSDWNCGWGWSTESQWAPVHFDPGDPERQIVYSKHIAREHCTDAFMVDVNRVADKYDVPLFFDEVENGELMGLSDTLWFYQFLLRNPRKFGFGTWVAGQYWGEFAMATAPFAQHYLPRPPFIDDAHPIVKWWRVTSPAVEKKGETTWYTYTLPQPMSKGDYGIVIDDLGTSLSCRLAIKPQKNKPELIGAWLGQPNEAVWLSCPFNDYKGSAIPNASYFHSLKSFEQLVLKTTSAFKQPPGIQLFRLNPKHQMGVPKVEKPTVNP